jgi:hypothetical protein
LVAVRLGRSHATVARRGFVAQVLRRHYQGKPASPCRSPPSTSSQGPKPGTRTGGRYAQLAFCSARVLVEVVGIAFRVR